MSATTSPRRRRSDYVWYDPRSETARAVWLFVVTGLVLWALIGIQLERRHIVFTNCESANERYMNAVHKLDVLIEKAPPERKAQARASRDGTVGLIATLAPPHFDGRRDRAHPYGASTCRALAEKQVSVSPF